MAAPAAGSGPGGSSGGITGGAGGSLGVVGPSTSTSSVNPFLSDSEEEEDGGEEEEEEEEDDNEEDDEDVSPLNERPAASLASRYLQDEADSTLLPSAGPRLCLQPGEPGRVPLDAVAAQLLRDQLLLTALELHTELLESGRELPRLRDYFSNPGNFERATAAPPGFGGNTTASTGGQLNRAGSISTLDSLDFARYSDDGNRETDERVAVLEFELRKAKETIQALRVNLTLAAENEVPLQERKNYKSSPEIQEPIKPLEKRALNFLVNEYLLKNNNKLTSITFSDENDDQDFELWDDVGLNTPKPPDLLQLYRNLSNHQTVSKDVADIAVGVIEGDLEPIQAVKQIAPDSHISQQAAIIKELEDKIILCNNEKAALLEQIGNLERQIESLQKENSASGVCSAAPPTSDRLQSQTSEESDHYIDIQITDSDAKCEGTEERLPFQQSECEPVCQVSEDIPPSPELAKIRKTTLLSAPPSKAGVHFDKPNRKLSPAFHQALLSFCRMSADSRLGSEVSQIADSENGVMKMLGRCLPHIVPNVLLAKREELIPLILCTACLHPESKERDQLLHILFNLIKRPDDEQRQMILTGCVAFARHVGPTRVEAELLPQCWEQINHKYPERRLLVAESCGDLAPYLPKEIRSSLVLAMLQQMLMEDKADMVREAVIKSLGIIMGYIDDPDKYSQGFELLLTALGDPSERVVSATHQVFLPAYAAWTMELGNLQSHLIPTLLSKIEKLLKEGEHGLDEHKLHMYLSALQSLIPSLFATVLQNAPFTSKAKLQGEVPQIEVTRFPRPVSPLQDVATIIGSREQLAVLLQLYDYQLEHEGTTGWESLLWVVNQLLPQLIEIVGRITVTSTASVHEFSRFFWRLCRTFGKIFTNTKVKPQFQEILRLSEENIDSTAGNGVLTKATVPIYATGVLTCYNQEEDRKLLVGFLEDVMTMLSLSHAPLDSLKASFVELGTNPAYHELLLTVLWYGVVHTSALVRCTAARMFELILRGMSESLVDKRVAPALVTLSSDPEFSVRIATVPAFGTIMETVTQRELLERVKMQLASFLEDPQYQDQHSLQTEIIRTFGRVGPNAEPRFRDDFVLPHLHKLSFVNNQQSVDSKRLDIATHLFEAYSALSCCFISEELMMNHFLPGLRCLRTDMEQLSPEHEVILSSMIKECEQKVENKTVQEPQGSMSIAASLVSEDTKTKFLNKMGQLTTSGAMLANVFQRKK
ncbi:RAB11-binding protein RELCH homolog isoform X2 [Xenopus tropicalis]|uniref:LisH domain and HEAT repeat-containing protein KIAA1468 n=1 Tax=Xenopus tropicalis TaxID=8364 RepID=A0A8J0SQ71_XENTR|nr:RAB11-binding protein RELCH homolog isoform X2 [Xenopus tropicalis]|eukprot:XP_012819764.1 PREDICTED: lisH domain and HEAT repeat-containing protein KIAA1468 homolog isoform X2 [Xenopus tropicalis]